MLVNKICVSSGAFLYNTWYKPPVNKDWSVPIQELLCVWIPAYLLRRLLLLAH